MKILEDGRTVSIKADFKRLKIDIEMSILHLAKIFGMDCEVVNDAENNFGSGKYEDACLETMELMKKYPNVPSNDIEYEVFVVGTKDNRSNRDHLDKDIIRIFAEGDFNGWDNEGILIKMPDSLYDEDFRARKLKLIFTSNSLIFILEPLNHQGEINGFVIDELAQRVGKLSPEEIDLLWYKTGWVDVEKGTNKALPEWRVTEMKHNYSVRKNMIYMLINDQPYASRENLHNFQKELKEIEFHSEGK